MVEKKLSKSWYSYQVDAERAFLSAAIPEIKKIAAGHADSVSVEGVNTPFLHYVGEDSNDGSLAVAFSIGSTSYGRGDARLAFFCDSALLGHVDDEIVSPEGEMTPKMIVKVFRRLFSDHGRNPRRRRRR